ncbi:MAG: hypothetical protein AAF772_19340 [Acidobacteriota bacterium]
MLSQNNVRHYCIENVTRCDSKIADALHESKHLHQSARAVAMAASPPAVCGGLPD